MGLMSYKTYKFYKNLMNQFKDLGITEEDFKKLPALIKRVEELEKKLSYTRVTPTEKEKQSFESKQSITPEDLVKAFSGDVEEFYPDGR